MLALSRLVTPLIIAEFNLTNITLSLEEKNPTKLLGLFVCCFLVERFLLGVGVSAGFCRQSSGIPLRVVNKESWGQVRECIAQCMAH